MCITNKLILFDLEGVLLKEDRTFSQDVLKSLIKLKDSEVMFGVMTSELWLKASGYTNTISPDIAIVSDGTQVYKDDEFIWGQSLSLEQSKGIVRDLSNNPRCSFIGISSGKNIFTNDPSEDRNYIRYRDMSFPLKQAVDKVIAKTTKEIAAEICSKYQCRSFDFDGDDLCRFISNKADFVTAVENTCRILDIDIKETIAVTSDIDVLKAVGIGVAPAGASDEVKDIAGLILGEDDSDSLVEFLKEVILSE